MIVISIWMIIFFSRWNSDTFESFQNVIFCAFNVFDPLCLIVQCTSTNTYQINFLFLTCLEYFLISIVSSYIGNIVNFFLVYKRYCRILDILIHDFLKWIQYYTKYGFIFFQSYLLFLIMIGNIFFILIYI